MSVGAGKIRALLRLSAVFCASLALTIGLQWHGNAYQAEWNGEPDESVHYVTGLMLHDYISSGLPALPLAYAQRYYEHYPKVAIGHWPPVFYILQSLWTLLFSPSRTSLLLLMAVIGALFLTCTFALVRLFFPAWMAWLSMILLAATPDFQSSSRLLMAELPTALFTVAALWALAHYFDQPGLQTAAWFSFASLAAVLTKGTGIALAPMPLLTAILTRRWNILRTGFFWLPAILAGVPAMVWFAIAPDALQQSVGLFGGLGIRWTRIPESLEHWLLSLGIAGAALAGLGFLRRASAAAAGAEKNPLWVSAVVFLPVTIAFRVILGAWEVRHLITTLPLLMLFLCDGLLWILSRIPRFQSVAAAMAVAALGLAAVHSVMVMPAKVHLGIDRAAFDLATAPDFRSARFLIVSDPLGEGVFISEVAVRESRPGHTIERGNKILADQSFMGDRYRPRFTTTAEMMRFFDQGPQRILILDGVPSVPEHVDQVRRMIREYPDRWLLVGRYPRAAAPFPLEVYRLSDTPGRHSTE